MNAIDYINSVGGEWAQLLALLFAGLLLILKVAAGVKTVLPDLWIPQKTVRLADYDLDERSMMAPEFQEFNEMQAFKRIWGIRAGRERRLQLIRFRDRFRARLDERDIKHAYGYMRFEGGEVRICFRWYDRLYNLLFQCFKYAALAIWVYLIALLAVKGVFDERSVGAGDVAVVMGVALPLFIALILLAMSNQSYTSAKKVKRVLEE